MASAKKIGRGVEESVGKALANISASTPKPDMKGSDTELKSAVAPKKAETFAEAFKANRVAGNKTFTWGGKSYTTKMAGEGPKRSGTAPAKAATSAAKPAAKADVSAAKPAVETKTRAQLEAGRTAARSQAAIRKRRAENQVDFRRRVQSGDIKPTERRPLLLTGEAARKANQGTIGGRTEAPKPAAPTAKPTAKPAAQPTATAKAQNGFKPGPFVNTPKEDVAKRHGLDTASAIRRLPVYRENKTRDLYLTDKLKPEQNSAKKPGQKSDFYRPGEKPRVISKAKGGKIDGAAIRGKTRAPLKKGK